MELKLSKYKACICEGSAENAIIDILVDEHLLIFEREEMLDEEVIRCRNAKRFEERYLRKGFDDQISIIRILDSRRESFKLSKAYEHKIDVINVITAPEIEMLIILSEGKYNQFKKSGKKPSDFCKQDLKMSNVKSYDFVHDYFSDSEKLVDAIRKYSEVSKIQRGEYTLRDLLRNKMK
jgi:hypothetical protein